MLRLALCSGLALGISSSAMAADFALAHAVPLTPETAAAAAGTLALATDDEPAGGAANAAPVSAPVPATPQSQPSKPAAPAPPPRDPTLISVPSNTLGPGTPLWVQREHEAAEVRIAQAEADYASARAALAQIEAQQAADDYNNYGDGVVVYGPYRPGIYGAIRNRPMPPRHRVERPGEVGNRDHHDDHAVIGQPVDDDPFDAAQREFYDAARPRIGAIIEPQLEAQRRFGNNAYPTKIIGIQNGIDRAVINARRGAPKPQDARKP
jgi:hypothetical protein